MGILLSRTQSKNMLAARANAAQGQQMLRGLNKDVRQIMKTLEKLPIDVRKERKRILRKAAKPLVAAIQAKAPVLKNRRKVTITLKNGSKVTYYPNNLRLAIRVLDFRRTQSVFVGPKLTRKRKEGEEYGKSRAKVDAFYAAMIEYGTKNMSARPYMRPAYEATKGQVLAIIRQEVEKLVREFGKKNEV